MHVREHFVAQTSQLAAYTQSEGTLEIGGSLVLEFTRDPALIEQYRQLRQRLYAIDERFVGFRFFSEPEADSFVENDDHLLIIHDGKRCYGGACLRISTPLQPAALDLESEILPASGKFYFSLREHLPEMQLDRYAYAEMTRMSLDPEMRQGVVTRRLFQAMLEQCIRYRVRYMFGISDRLRTRFYRQIYTNMGMDCHIDEKLNIAVREEHEGIKMHLLCGDMKKFHVTSNDPDASTLLFPVDPRAALPSGISLATEFPSIH